MSTSVLIDGFPIDATVSESHAFDLDVTDHPVEEGADITDNARIRPAVITLSCIVSDTPLAAVASARDLPGGGGGAPSDEAYARMLAIRDAREPVVVTTSIATYANMVLQSLSIPRAASDGESLRFSATFKEVRIVKNDRKRVSVPRAKGKVNRGNKPANLVGGTDAATEAVSSGYQDTVLGQLTDEAGITSGPAVNLVPGT